SGAPYEVISMAFMAFQKQGRRARHRIRSARERRLQQHLRARRFQGSAGRVARSVLRAVRRLRLRLSVRWRVVAALEAVAVVVAVVAVAVAAAVFARCTVATRCAVAAIATTVTTVFARRTLLVLHAGRTLGERTHRQLDATLLVGLQNADFDDLAFAQVVGD